MSASKEEEDIPKSIQQLCRLCLGDELLEDIFKREEDLHEWISDFLSITVCVDDKLSKSICYCCRTRLHEFRNFQQQCLEVQDVLKGEITAILDEKALKLIVTDAEHADVTDKEGFSADWDEVSEINQEEALCEELYGHDTVRDLPEKTNEWQAEATGVPVVLDSESEDFHSEATSELGRVSLIQFDVTANQPEEDSMNNTFMSNMTVSTKAKQENNPLQCTYCGKVSKTKMNYYNHRRIHLKKHSCPFCDKSFNRLSYFKRHMNTHKKRQPKITAITDKKIQASNVDEETEVVKQLDEIKVEVINVDEETEEVEKDDVVFVEPMLAESETIPISNDVVESIKVEELIIEDVEIEEDTIPQSSTIGDESFAPVEDAVGRKSLADQNMRENELQCDQCNKQLLTKKQYQIHTYYVHGPKPYICSVCNKDFISMGRLAIHQKFHKSKIAIDKTKSELATCEQIARSRDMNVNERPSKCDLEQATSDQELIAKSGGAIKEMHRARIVHGLNKLECSICRKKFSTTDMVKKNVCAAHSGYYDEQQGGGSHPKDKYNLNYDMQ